MEMNYFCSPFVAVDQKLVGGVTLNHLSWAALGGGEDVVCDGRCLRQTYQGFIQRGAGPGISPPPPPRILGVEYK